MPIGTYIEQLFKQYATPNQQALWPATNCAELFARKAPHLMGRQSSGRYGSCATPQGSEAWSTRLLEISS